MELQRASRTHADRDKFTAPSVAKDFKKAWTCNVQNAKLLAAIGSVCCRLP